MHGGQVWFVADTVIWIDNPSRRIGKRAFVRPHHSLPRLPSSNTEFTGLLLARAAAALISRPRLLPWRSVSARRRCAVSALTAKLDKLNAQEQRFLVERLLPRLFGDGIIEPEVKMPALPLGVMERLVTIAFRTVRVEDDNHHEDGVSYSPDTRDAAERARSALFNLLIGTPGRATVDTLHRFKSVPDMPIQPGRLDELIFTRAADNSEHSPWNPGEAYALEQQFDSTPNTPTDLQSVAIRRLSDIQHDLHHADFAQGKTFKALPKEVDVQNWIANELRNRQGRAYSVEREPHVVEEKEPDIRLRARSTDAALPIEVKVAESWTLAKLEEALVAQLCGRYLRSQDGRHGILLLVHQNARSQGWEKPDGIFLSFGELVAHLQGNRGRTSCPQFRCPAGASCHTGCFLYCVSLDRGAPCVSTHSGGASEALTAKRRRRMDALGRKRLPAS